MNNDFFQILANDKKTQARAGVINTAHGKILTPAFVPVGSQATVKSLTPEDLKKIGVQVFFANTYHLYLRPGEEIVDSFGGLHNFMSWDRPLMTDSGGFQVFSLGSGKIKKSKSHLAQKEKESLVKIDYNGVTFQSHLDGSKHYFTPEKSIEIQKKLGADMIIAFDECASFPTTHEYAQTAMARTHRWAIRSLEAFNQIKNQKKQFLYGVIQGSLFDDLRQESAQFISSLAFDGLAVGGVAVGESKKEMAKVLDWVMPILAKNKKIRPVHLLGVGEIDDVFEAVARGVDTMDCVMPTRLGRMGHILVKGRNNPYDINKAIFAKDKSPIGDRCQCSVCCQFSKAYLHHLFRANELLAYRLATYHNLFLMEELFAKIREAIKKGEFLELKKQWLKK